jgi:TolB protein
MDLRSRSTNRLTTNPAIDTAATFAPKGDRLVFESDRGGTPQIYTMKADGSDVKRISFGKGRYSNPVWSPRGDKIAFVRQLSGKFAIGVMDEDGKNMRILSESWSEEAPTWSPNGRVVLFHRTARGSGNSQLWAVDLTGQNLRKINTGGNASDPAWSPILD